MPLPSFLQRLRKGASGATSAADAMPLSQTDIEVSRTRARRRLIGMVVLVGAGVVGFPWLFETQPRPMSSDVQIVQEAPSGSGGASTPNGQAHPMASSKVAVVGSVAAQASEPESVGEGRPRVADRPMSMAATVPAVPISREPVEEVVSDDAPVAPASQAKAGDAAQRKAEKKKPEDRQAEAKAASKAAPAKAVQAKPADKVAEKPAGKDDARYIVQVGAFSESSKAQEVRLKVEHLGIKTYAQAVDTPQGKRIRVRVGPYADKADAEKALATLRKAGLAGNLLTL